MSDKVDIAVKRLKEATEMSQALYEQPLVITYSGGKDSDTKLMEPVINPLAFYLIDSASTLKWGALIFGIIIGFILLCYGSWSLNEADSKEEVKSAERKLKTGLTIVIIGAVLFILLPSSKTVMKMVIAKNVTYDTVDAAKDVVVQVYNDILALFQK